MNEETFRTQITTN